VPLLGPAAEGETLRGKAGKHDYDSGFEDGYDKGYELGLNNGFESGYNKGFEDGSRDGYEKGWKAGIPKGYSEGYEFGQKIGYENGFEVGYRDGNCESEVRFDQGYAQGYMEGYQKGVDEGYTEGLTRSASILNLTGEQMGICCQDNTACLEAILPEDKIIIGYDGQDLIRLGLKQVEQSTYPAKTLNDTIQLLKQALKTRQGFSLIALGNPEAMVLAGERTVPLSQSDAGESSPGHREGPVLAPGTREGLVRCITRATVIAFPGTGQTGHRALLLRALEANGIDWRTLPLARLSLRGALLASGHLTRLVLKKSTRLVVVGHCTRELAGFLEARGATVAGAVELDSPGIDPGEVTNRIRDLECNLVLVAGGVPGKLVAVKVATELNRVAIDIDHMVDQVKACLAVD